MAARPRQPNLLIGALVGAAAGLAGSWAMVRFNHLIGEDNGTSDKSADSHPHRRREARPNDTDGTIPDEPGSMQAASAVAEPILGRPLSEREKAIGGPVVHYLFGAGVGALYGAAAEWDRTITTGLGIPFGVTVWLVADEIGMHAAGFASSPEDYPLSRHVATFATHVVFGITVETIRRAIRGSRNHSSARTNHARQRTRDEYRSSAAFR